MIDITRKMSFQLRIYSEIMIPHDLCRNTCRIIVIAMSTKDHQQYKLATHTCHFHSLKVILPQHRLGLNMVAEYVGPMTELMYELPCQLSIYSSIMMPCNLWKLVWYNCHNHVSQTNRRTPAEYAFVAVTVVKEQVT